MDLQRFVADVTSLSGRMSAGEPEEVVERMNFVKNRLIESASPEAEPAQTEAAAPLMH